MASGRTARTSHSVWRRDSLRKRAVAKALGTGIGDVSWREIELRTDGARRRPALHLHGAAKDLAERLGLTEWDVSLSHTDEHAIAVAVAK